MAAQLCPMHEHVKACYSAKCAAHGCQKYRAAPLINDIIKFLEDIVHPEQFGHAVPLDARTRARVLRERILMEVPSRDAAMADGS